MDFLNILKNNSEALTVIFSAVVTISTVVYALLTAKLVNETRKLREVQTEPRMEVKLESFEDAINIIRLKIKNIGFGSAYDLKFSITIISGGEEAEKMINEFKKTEFFKTGLKYFWPSQELDSGYTYFPETAEDIKFTVNVQYMSLTKKQYADSILIDMAEMLGGYRLGTPPIYSMAKSLEKIKDDLSRLTNGNKRIKVDSYSQEDRNKEDEEFKKRYEKRNS